MPETKNRIRGLVQEIRSRAVALRRAWRVETIHRAAAELSVRFQVDEALVTALIREEVGGTAVDLPRLDDTRGTRRELPPADGGR